MKKKEKIRSYVARNPLMRKGGAHVKAKSSGRFASKQKLRKEVRECDSRPQAFAAIFSLISPLY
ncbi:hypothetical protein ACJJI4_05915 [Microbulbifer sp. TRSA002]|uniref:hypothetical protein n=1 Tax=Microbulbifer sp. TRSA002 TaxID=3243382 RepID=UPI004039C5CF